MNVNVRVKTNNKVITKEKMKLQGKRNEISTISKKKTRNRENRIMTMMKYWRRR